MSFFRARISILTIGFACGLSAGAADQPTLSPEVARASFTSRSEIVRATVARSNSFP